MTKPADPQRVLILFAHPAFERSRVNRRLTQAVRDIEGVTFHDLYEAYPEMHIIVPHEQQLMEEHDIVILQHPFFWYSTPAIFKEWQDLVLTHGWAFGTGGTALNGKRVMNAISTGGGEQAYQPGGYNRFTIRQLLAPIEQTCNLCGMRFLPPFVLHGTHSLNPEKLDRHAEEYRRLVIALRDNAVDYDKLESMARANADLDSILIGGSHAR